MTGNLAQSATRRECFLTHAFSPLVCLSVRMSKANTQVVTRSRTGSLAPTRVERLESSALSSPSATTAAAIVKQEIGAATAAGPTRIATADEIKQQMEQNLRMQRAAHNQRRSLDPSGKPNILKIPPPTPGKCKTIVTM